MENKNQIHNNFPFINISEVNELISSIKGNKYIVKISDTIRYDIIFESLSSGSQLSTIIQETRHLS